ncbi:hypothetical protein [Paenibacillus sp. Leaf72]|uniref:hypothetical protein n=1 Tax=Paenibacillus sp. Leaf72 TaxID=1736234 RepID=UPI000A75F64B|nr:hypothetical protein [Paenibacillus sp. Leaf72]
MINQIIVIVCMLGGIAYFILAGRNIIKEDSKQHDLLLEKLKQRDEERMRVGRNLVEE